MQKIFITGGAGYVGSLLVPALLEEGYEVTVFDLMIYGEDKLPDHPKLSKIKGDIREIGDIDKAMTGHDVVIHLACISNDPSFELDPDLGKSINLDAFEPIVKIAREKGVKRFIFASSASVYGIKDVPNVTEDITLEPLTDYSRFKVECEQILANYQSPGFTTVVVRPATLCGYAKRLRLDLTVNILSTHALVNGKITVFGGQQKRPNLHIQDMVRVYQLLLNLPDARIAGGTYNAGYENHTVSEIAQMVKRVIGEHVTIKTTPSDDQRSYHISSEKIKRELGFTPVFSIEDAVKDLKEAYQAGLIPNALSDPSYVNVKQMQKLALA